MQAGISLTPTSYIVLGLLEQAGPSTPYDLKALVAASVGNLWSVPHSQLYAEPKRLAAGGYLAERREQAGRRRRTYELTDAGREALDAWRVDAAVEPTELRDLGLLKLFFGADPRQVAPGQLAAHEAKLAEYEQIYAAIPEAGRASGPVLTLEAGIAHEREWVQYWRRLAD